MNARDKNLEQKCAALEILLEEAKQRTEYYRNIAEVVGKKRLRETEKLSKLIAQQKSTEKMLKESEKKYRFLFEKSPAIKMIIGADGKIKDINQTFLGISQYSKEELIDKDALTFVVPDHRKKVIKRFAQTFNQNIETNIDLDVMDKDGTIRTVLFSSSKAVSHEDGKPASILLSGIDITKRKETEEKLKTSEEKYRLVVENANVGILVLENEKILFMNRAISVFFGYTTDEITGKSPFDFVHPDEREMVVDLHYKRIGGSDIPQTYRFRVVDRNGDTIWVEVSAFQIMWENRPATLSFFVDVTEQIQTEEEKRKLEMQFQHAQKMESIGTLAGGVAHDFNNLLMAIQGNTSLMLIDIDSGHPHYERLKNITRYVENGAGLTKQLLGFARSGKYEVKTSDINEILKKSSEMFGRARKEIKIHTKCQSGIWNVDVDRGQIEQVLLNIYVNAWQATSNGGKLYLLTENVMLTESYATLFNVRPGKYVKISIEDNGVGMDTDTQQRIFDPFFTTKDRGRGTGLGLASAYGIIKNHGGIITVDSEKGIGTTFKIYLPASDKKITTEDKTYKKFVKGCGKVLLVDDEEMIVDVGQRFLETMGYEVLVAQSGESAIEVYRNHQNTVDLVVLDMIMPDMSGEEAYNRLKGVNPDVKVLLASGYSIEGQATSILEHGCNGFIQKPFDIQSLSQKISDVLNNEKLE